MENEAPDGGDKKTEDVLPRSEAEKAFAARDKAKAELKELRQEFSTVREQLEAFQQEKAEAEEAAQRKAGEFDKLMAKRETEWAKKQKEKDARIAELEQAEQRRIKQDRFSRFKGAILGKAKADPVVLEGLMLKAEMEGMDVAPEEFSEETVADAIKRLRGMSEAAFQTKAMGVAPSSADHPGGQTNQQQASEVLNRYSKGAAWRARYSQ